MIGIDYSFALNIVLLLFFGFLYFFSQGKALHFGGLIGFLYVLSTLGVPNLMLIVVGAVMVAITFGFLTSKRTAVFVVLLLGVVLNPMVAYAVPGDDSPSNDNNGIPQRVALVEEVLKVREVLEVTNQSEMDIKGTDYVPGDIGKLQVYLSVGGFPITTATCYASVLYPDMNYFIEHELMLPANKTYFEGLYYYDFVVPNVTGVYPVNAICSYDTDNIVDYVDFITYDGLGDITGNSLSYLEEDDGVDFGIQDFAACNGVNCTANFSINLPLGWYTNQVNTARLLLEVEQTKAKDVYWYVHAPSINQSFLWFVMTDSNTPYIEQFELNSTFQFETELIVEAVGVDYQATKMYVDYLFSTRAYTGTVVNDLRGNEELVVSAGIYNMTETVQLIYNTDIDFIEPETSFNILLLIAAGLALVTGFLVWSGLLLLVWVIIFAPSLYIGLLLSIIGVLLVYGGYKKNKG